MIIAICGFMGAGKTSFLKMYPDVSSVDLDKFMEEELGSELGSYIRENGWKAFRDFESKSLIKALDSLGNTGLISLGGGTVDSSENREALVQKGVKVLHLEVSFEEAMERIEGDTNRPQLDKSLKELKELYLERKKVFTEAKGCSLPSDSSVWPTNWTVLKSLF